MGEDELTIKTLLDTSGLAKGSKEILKAVNNLGKQFVGMGKKIGGTVKSLIGIGSVIGILSKAINTYMGQNEQLSKKMQAIWTALGNVLAPVINAVCDIILRAVSYLLEFLRVLGITGKTASELSKKAGGAAGSLQRTLAGFDELNVLSQGGGSGSGTLDNADLDSFLDGLEELIKEGAWRKIGELVAGKFNEMIDKVCEKAPEWGRKLGDAIWGALEFMIGFVGTLDWNKIGLSIREFFLGLFENWDDIKKDIGELLAKILTGAFELVWGLLGNEMEEGEELPIQKSIENLIAKLGELWDLIEEFAENAWEKVLKPFLEWSIEEGLPAVLDEISKILSDIIGLLKGDTTFGEFLKNLDGIETVLLEIGTIVATGKILKFIRDLKLAIGGLSGEAEVAVKSISGLLKDAGAAVSLGAEALGMSTVGFVGTVGAVAGAVALGAYAIYDYCEADKEMVASLEEAGSSLESSKVAFEEHIATLGKAGQEERILATCGGDLTAVQSTLTNETRYCALAYQNYVTQSTLAGEQTLTFQEYMASMGYTTRDAKDGINKYVEVLDSSGNVVLSFSKHNVDLMNDIYGQADALAEAAGKTNEMKDNVEETVNAVDEFAGMTEEEIELMQDSAEDIEKKKELVGEYEEQVVGSSEKMRTAWEELAKAIGDTSSEIKESINLTVQGINEAIEGVVSNSYSWGLDIGNQLAQGIRDSYVVVQEASIYIAGVISSYLHFSEPDKGPLSNFHTYMPDMMKMMAEGIEDNENVAISALENMTQGMSDSIYSKVESIGQNVPYAMPAMATGGIVPYGVGSDIGGGRGMSDALSRIEQMMGNFGGNNDVPKIQLFIDGKEITDVVTKRQRQNERAGGR